MHGRQQTYILKAQSAMWSWTIYTYKPLAYTVAHTVVHMVNSTKLISFFYWVLFINAGKIPLHELVYRVHEIPESMLPLIFDFGRLDDLTERKYIGEIVKNRVFYF